MRTLISLMLIAPQADRGYQAGRDAHVVQFPDSSFSGNGNSLKTEVVPPSQGPLQISSIPLLDAGILWESSVD